MAHIVRERPWGVIDLDTETGRIFFQERWFYNWTTAPGVSPWTLRERRNFHNTLDRQIWGSWSNRVRLRTAGASQFCRRFREVPINFDVRWVTAHGHWTVNVRKMPAGSSRTAHRSSVNFAARIINLDTADLAPDQACNTAGVCRPNFRSGPHEFGHTLDNRDEYAARSRHLRDSTSIMNIGTQVRGRHLELILAELNTMVPDCSFSGG